MNQPAIAVHSFFQDRLIDLQVLEPRHRRGGGRGDSYRIGSGRRVDAPVGERFVGAPEHALVTVDERGATLHLTARMVGTVRVPGGAQSLATLLPAGAGDLTLAADSHAEVRCGAMTFQIAATDLAAIETLPAPRASWRQQGYTLAVAAATVLGLAVLSLVPADPKALSLDLIDVNHRMGPILIRAPEPPPVSAGAPAASGTASPAGASPANPGTAGAPTAPRRPRPARLAVKGASDRYDPRTDPNPVSVLSLLSTTRSSTVQGILAPGDALGPDADDVLGTLVAAPEGAAYGVGGLGLHSTGAGAAGTGEGLKGSGVLGRLPGLGRYGDGVGKLPRGAGGPLHAGPGTKVPPQPDGWIVARGSLDKELVRRTIRAHLNEVRYCYEQELPRHPTLAGRIAVQFVIMPTGQVTSSVVQESTLHLGSLEGCVTQAVRRWTFPQPTGGGLTVVTYPFVLARSGV